MLQEAKLQYLHQIVQQYTQEELLWISGYLAGIAREGNATPTYTPATTTAVKTASIVYGTETGNSKKAAMQAAGVLKQKGIRVKLAALEQYKLQDLPKEEHLLVVISTQGEGEPPETAKKFYDYIHQQSADLKSLSYSVLALGSKSYPLFCQAGIDVDNQLQKLGAHRIAPVVTCDEDYEADAHLWIDTVLQKLNGQANGQTNGHAPAAAAATAPATKPVATGKQHFTAEVSLNILLNDKGSRQQVYHIELTTHERVAYEPGDALGLVPQNTDAEVTRVLEALHLDPEQPVAYKQENYSAADLLKKKVNLLHLSERLVKKYAQLVDQEIPPTRMDFFDLVRIYPVKDPVQAMEALALLDPMAPRLYSIASSPAAHGDEIHLTVEKAGFRKHDTQAWGLCSHYLSRLAPGSTFQAFLHRQKHFRLPAPDKDIIMIGAVTGIAPFRSFLAERDATGASGKNWLFFGEQQFTTDFYYQTEIQEWNALGVLQKVSLAFAEEYSQYRQVHECMTHEADEIWAWLTNGAYLYVSGDKEVMAKQVEATLLSIIASKKQCSPEDALTWLKDLAKQGRYEKDIY